MNIWANKSFKIAKGKGYLDKLSKIYPVDDGTGEIVPVDNKIIKHIKQLFTSKKREELLLYLLDFKRFPFDDPYVGFLRHDIKAIKNNPQTINRLWVKLTNLGLVEIIQGISRPKSASRKFGQYFSNWLKTEFPTLSEKDFISSKKKIAVLSGGDVSLQKFAKDNLGYSRSKGLDFVVKVKNNFVIGEAKFVSHSGGTQDKSVREAIDFVSGVKVNQNVLKVAVIDGVPWVGSSSLYKSLKDLDIDRNVMSALLLKKFFKSF